MTWSCLRSLYSLLAAALNAASASLRSCRTCSECKGRATAAEGDAEFLDAASRFLPACSPDQVRLVPEKCERGGALRTPALPWCLPASLPAVALRTLVLLPLRGGTGASKED